MSEMDEYQRAVQIWSVLILAARTQEILSYEMVGQLTGLAPVGLGRTLGNVAAYCVAHKLPALTALVVKKETGVPAVELPGAKIPDIHAEQARVFVYDWLSHGAPKVEDFRVARGKVFGSETVKAATT